MKLTITSPTKERAQEEIGLYLEKSGDDCVQLKARRMGTEYTWTILSFFSSGSAHRVGCVSPCLGFDLDTEGKIIFE